MASDVIEEVDASKGESDALISMGSAFTQEDACVKDEPARLSWKRAEVKGIERTIIGMGAAGKQIDAAISAIDDDTKGVPSTSIEDRSASKEMRHDRTGETAETLAFLSVPTCFTARGKELGAGLPAFQAAPIGMADEAKTFTALSPDDVGTVCG